MFSMSIPNHYIHIHGLLYMDPEARDIGFQMPDVLDEQWVQTAIDALTVFSRDIPGWSARAKYGGILSLRFQLSDGFVNERVFDHDSLPATAEEPLAAFVDAVTQANADRPLWGDSENHLAGDIAVRLAERSIDEVLRFVRFLESNDLDHEVSQAWHIARIIQAHGWRPQTLALWVARLGTCAGQHGHETEWDQYSEQSIQDFVASNPDHRTLLVQLMSGNMVADQRELRHEVEHHLAVLVDDTIDIFWDDLEEQGLGDLAESILKETQERAQKLIRKYTGSGQAPPHWLSVM